MEPSVREKTQRLILATLLFLLGFRTATPSAATVAIGHPRVLLTASDVGALRSRCLNVVPYRDVYASLKSRVDSWTTPTTNRYVIGYEIQAVVMVALVENYKATYLTKTDQWLRNLFETQGMVNLARAGDAGAIWGASDTILGVAWALDWLYPALDSATRARYGRYLLDFQDAVISQQGGMTRDGSRSDYSNQFYYFDGMLAITGIALSGEHVDDAKALTYMNAFDGNVRQNMLPVVNQVGGVNGGWHEGPGYVERGMTVFALELEAWRIGTGEDLFPQASGLRNLGKWLFYSTQPDGVVVNVGDVSGWPTRWSAEVGKRSSLLAARYRDGFSQYLANRVSPTSDWTYAVFYLLWHDSTVSEIVPASVARDQYFDGVGWASMRSGWSGSDVFALFTSGNYYFGHQHYDQNSFQIFRSAPLAIDNGIYNIGSPGYKTATRFHNTILVGDPGSATSTSDGAAGQTGASPQLYLPAPEGTSSDKGDILRYESAPQYTFVVGDASGAYSSSRLTSYVRKFLYVRPDYFVVLDRIILPATSYPIRWMLQSDTAPAISGRDVRVINGGGQLQMRTLLPADAALSSFSVFSGVSEYGGGNYRTEVVPGTRRAQETFLHVLRATDAQTSQMTDARIVRSASGALVGTHFGGQVVLLADVLTPTSAESYTISSATAINHLVGDLVPSARYDVRRDGGALTTVTASQNGVLWFSSPAGGTFTLVLSGTAPSTPKNLQLIP
jgi:heparinase II/III-like protein